MKLKTSSCPTVKACCGNWFTNSSAILSVSNGSVVVLHNKKPLNNNFKDPKIRHIHAHILRLKLRFNGHFPDSQLCRWFSAETLHPSFWNRQMGLLTGFHQARPHTFTITCIPRDFEAVLEPDALPIVQPIASYSLAYYYHNKYNMTKINRLRPLFLTCRQFYGHRSAWEKTTFPKTVTEI